MSARKPFPLRLRPEVLQALQRWADDELRSVNAQMEWALRDALRRAGRLKHPRNTSTIESSDEEQAT
ncbi:MAG TPA: Arc family DNA binding domain-containing protein [Xanthomonadaceae bacterium]|nr:Arc family DNA binding domain-containing protein [Xanthomonadaceae bacterium]